MTAPLRTPNRLSEEKSPYLLQHKDNPVHWWPWGPEALAQAKATGRPILLSVGYAACHWCHVMAHESFEDPATAAVMNEHFVNIKVDREQRPDVDAVYMEATQAMTGHGGWPMTVFLTPSQEPFPEAVQEPPEQPAGSPVKVTGCEPACESEIAEVGAIGKLVHVTGVSSSVMVPTPWPSKSGRTCPARPPSGPTGRGRCRYRWRRWRLTR